jgi:hypothetical protein
MDLQKLNVKFFIEDAGGVALDSFIGIFNSWIQASDGEYYDLADYGHVPAGPGIVLVAHGANISIDNKEDQLGLLYNRKQPVEGSNGEKLASAVTAALAYCRRIEDEPTLAGRLRFRGDEALVTINDRLSVPNTEDSFAALRPEVEAFGKRLFAGAEFTIERETEPRRRFAVRIKAAAPFTIRSLLENLQKNAN